eukprot:jgi/Mesen1/6127/ME000313S05254
MAHYYSPEAYPRQALWTDQNQYREYDRCAHEADNCSDAKRTGVNQKSRRRKVETFDSEWPDEPERQPSSNRWAICCACLCACFAIVLLASFGLVLYLLSFEHTSLAGQIAHQVSPFSYFADKATDDVHLSPPTSVQLAPPLPDTGPAGGGAGAVGATRAGADEEGAEEVECEEDDATGLPEAAQDAPEVVHPQGGPQGGVHKKPHFYLPGDVPFPRKCRRVGGREDNRLAVPYQPCIEYLQVEKQATQSGQAYLVTKGHKLGYTPQMESLLRALWLAKLTDSVLVLPPFYMTYDALPDVYETYMAKYFDVPRFIQQVAPPPPALVLPGSCTLARAVYSYGVSTRVVHMLALSFFWAASPMLSSAPAPTEERQLLKLRCGGTGSWVWGAWWVLGAQIYTGVLVVKRLPEEVKQRVFNGGSGGSDDVDKALKQGNPLVARLPHVLLAAPSPSDRVVTQWRESVAPRVHSGELQVLVYVTSLQMEFESEAQKQLKKDGLAAFWPSKDIRLVTSQVQDLMRERYFQAFLAQQQQPQQLRFAALHLRMDQGPNLVPVGEMLRVLQRVADPRVVLLYVATGDFAEREAALAELRRVYTLVTKDDLLVDLRRRYPEREILAAFEMWVAKEALVFVGPGESSFTGLLYQMRCFTPTVSGQLLRASVFYDHGPDIVPCQIRPRY